MHDRAMGGLVGWQRLVGRWITEGDYPHVPGEVVLGETVFEWLDDQQCLVQRILYDHPAIPDGLLVTAVLEGEPTMHYFSARGEHSVFTVEITDEAWRFWNLDPGQARRWTGLFAEDDTVIHGRFERSADGEHWETDLEVTYRRTRRGSIDQMAL